MKTLMLVRGSGYKTPITGKNVENGVPFVVSDGEAEKCLEKGFFVELKDTTTLPVLKDATCKELPQDWAGKSILIKCPGGIGDALIASSISTHLKHQKCCITMAVSAKAVPFCSSISTIDHATDDFSEAGYDVVLNLDGFLQKNSREVISKEYYFAAYDFLGLGTNHIMLPSLDVAAPSRQLMGRVGSHAKGLIAVHPKASAEHRCWPIPRWRTFLASIPAEYKAIILGNSSEGLEDLAIDGTKFSEHEQMQILSTAKYFVGVDSCFAHLAGLLNIDSTVLFGPSDPRHVVARYPRTKTVSASNCRMCRTLRPTDCRDSMKCMTSISSKGVLDAVFQKDRNKPKVLQAPEYQRHTCAKDLSALERNTKVAFVFPHVVLGGGETSMMTVAANLEPYFDMEVFALKTWKLTIQQSIEEELVDRFDATFLDKSTLNTETFANFDVILFYGCNDLFLKTLSEMPSRPTTVRVVHTHFPKEGVECHNRWASVIDGVVCVSPVIADQIEGAEFIPNPVDPKVFEGPKKKFFDNDLPVAAYVGRMDNNKNTRWLLENLDQLKCNLLMQVLDSDQLNRKEALQIINDKNLEDRVYILEPSRDVGTVMKSADMLLLVSQQEALPMVVLEAGYMGLPVISTKVGALPTLFEEDINFVESIRGVPDIKELRTLVRDHKRLRKTSLQKKIQEMCDPFEVAEKYRKYVRKTFGRSFPEYVRGPIKVCRYQGIGDIIMATAAMRRIAEMFPDTEMTIETNKCMVDILKNTFPTVKVSPVGVPAKQIPLDYHECWDAHKRALEGMGGKLIEVGVDLPKETLRGRPLKKSVGLFPSMNKLASKRVKELPPEIWEQIAKILKKRGYQPVHLGHVSDTPIKGARDNRTENVEDMFAAFYRCTHVLATEGLANHIGFCLNKKIHIVMGGASNSWLTSYQMHDHYETTIPCRCFGSIKTEMIGERCALSDSFPCMRDRSAEEIVDWFLTSLDS